MIYAYIDELTPCLKDSETGEIFETEVIRIKRKSFLSKYNKKTGWYTNWASLLSEDEVYALVIKGTVDIQGLVAFHKVEDYSAVFISWMCAAPQNNPMVVQKKKYIGVGGHLFAIAVDKSIEYGYDGAVTGNAANKDLVKHYCEVFWAQQLGLIHPFQIFIDEINARKIKEVILSWK